VRRARDELGRIDIAVANAAVLGPVGPVADTSASAWANAIDINVCGTANVVRSVLPAMAGAGHGRIVTLSGGGVGGPNVADRVGAYVASKGAVMLLTEALSYE